MDEEELTGIVDRLAPVLGETELFAVVMDPGGRIVWANDAAAAGFGDLVGADLTSIVALLLRTGARDRLDEAVATTEPVPDFDTVVIDRHGNQAAVSVTLARLDAAEGVAGILGLLRVPTAARDGGDLLRSQALALLGRG